MKRPIRAQILAVLLVAFPIAALAGPHGGGLDRNGCHTNRKTGEYHCHRSPSTRVAPPRAAPRESPAPLMLKIERPNEVRNPITPVELVTSIELLLRSLGYDPGPPDGMITTETDTAIRTFQMDRGLHADGAATGKLLVQLSQAVVQASRR